MKWFKHLANSRNDPDIYDSKTIFRSAGPDFFWTTLEIFAEEFNINDPESITISFKYYCSQLRMRRSKVIQLLDFFGSRPIGKKEKRISYKIFIGPEGEEKIKLVIPKATQLADTFTQNCLRKKK